MYKWTMYSDDFSELVSSFCRVQDGCKECPFFMRTCPREDFDVEDVVFARYAEEMGIEKIEKESDCTSEPRRFTADVHDAADSPTESGTYFVCAAWVTDGKMRDYQWCVADYKNNKWMVSNGNLIVAWMNLPPDPSAAFVWKEN